MAWPTTNWYLPGGKGMVRTVGGVVNAVADADECCCEEPPSTTTAGYQADCPNCAACESTLYVVLTGTTCGGVNFTGPYAIWLWGGHNCYWWNSTALLPSIRLYCESGSLYPDGHARWSLSVANRVAFKFCIWRRELLSPAECPEGIYTISTPLGGGLDCGSCGTATVYS